MKSGEVLNYLRSRGCRITKSRRAIIEQLENLNTPTAEELFDSLIVRGQKVDRATVYRELSRLVEAGLIKQIEVGSESARYELGVDHHHHLICRKCQMVVCLTGLEIEKSLSSFEQSVAHQHKVKVLGHELYLTGYCQQCWEGRNG